MGIGGKGNCEASLAGWVGEFVVDLDLDTLTHWLC